MVANFVVRSTSSHLSPYCSLRRIPVFSAISSSDKCYLAMLYALGRFLVELSESRTGVFAFGLVSGGLAAAAQVGISQIARPWHVAAPTMFAAFSLGLFVAAVSWIEAAAVRARRLRVVECIKRIADLNHHVRNALQAIQYASYLPAGTDQVQIIQDEVQRIDQTLRDLFCCRAQPSRLTASVKVLVLHLIPPRFLRLSSSAWAQLAFSECRAMFTRIAIPRRLH